jgi:molybdopterin synthase catalytic subunit
MSQNVGIHPKGTVSLAGIVKSMKDKPSFRKAGAVASFIGVVRENNLREEKVQKLELEAYEEKSDEVLAKICEDLKQRPGIVDVQIHHLVGEFSVGEDLVYVVVAGSHRMDVFPVLEEAVERYKLEAPIFKKEYVITNSGAAKTYWVSEREGDE